MKKSLFLAAALCSTVAANAALSTTNFAGNDYVGEWGRLKLVGNQLSSESGQPVQLKGWSTFSINYGEVKPCLSEDAFKAMKEWGANIVRIAIYPSNKNGSYSQNDDTNIMKYIKWCYDNKMYALVDWHVLDCDEGAGSGNPAAKQNEAKGMFERIGKQVTENGYNNVLWEICNEPSGVSWDNIKTYADQVLPVIEKNAPNSIVIVGTPQWDQNIGDAVNAPIDKSKYKSLGLMYAFHFYACSHGYMIGRMTDAAASLPVFISEWGAVAFDGGGNFCADEATKFLGYLQPEGNSGGQLISWCYWAWGAKDETSNCIKPGSCSSPYNQSKLTQSGEYIVKVLTGKEEIPEVKASEYYDKQEIPSTKSDKWGEYGVLNVAYFDRGGQLVGYYDNNSSMYCKDGDGVVDRDCEDKDGIEYWTHNAGAYYGDWQFVHLQDHDYSEYFRFDEDADITNSTAGLDGTYGNVGDGMGTTDLHNLCMTEPGEWLKYTIVVNKPGYYKVQVLTTVTTKATGSIGLAIADGKKPGQNGNIIRSLASYKDEEKATPYVGLNLKPCEKNGGLYPDGTTQEPYGFHESWDPQTREKAAENGPHLCWGWIEPGGRKAKDICALFKYEGEQKLMLRISPDGEDTPGDFSNILFTYIDGMEIPEFEFQDSKDGVENVAASMDAINVYPNPSNGNFTVAVEGEANVSIYNAVGAMVYNQDVNGNVEVNGLAAGIYTVRVATAAGVKTLKAVVK